MEGGSGQLLLAHRPGDNTAEASQPRGRGTRRPRASVPPERPQLRHLPRPPALREPTESRRAPHRLPSVSVRAGVVRGPGCAGCGMEVPEEESFQALRAARSPRRQGGAAGAAATPGLAGTGSPSGRSCGEGGAEPPRRLGNSLCGRGAVGRGLPLSAAPAGPAAHLCGRRGRSGVAFPGALPPACPRREGPRAARPSGPLSRPARPQPSVSRRGGTGASSGRD